MKVIAKTIEDLSEKDFYIKHLQIITQVLPITLSQKEIEVLATFLSLSGDLIKKDRFGTTARKIVKEQLKLSDGGLGNHLKALKNKKYIFLNEFNVYEAYKHLFPEKDQQGYMFKIIKKNGK